jgi:two-component system, OmpR family, response regulator VicR
MHERVVIVEDDQALARLLRENLVYEGFAVEHAGTGHDARTKVESFDPELVLLDLTLPDDDGFEICQSLVSLPKRPLVIILSARSSHVDKVRGLDLGADDYVTKPFAFEELLARMRAVMRRRTSKLRTVYLGDVVVDFAARCATRRGRDLGLSQREIEVLHYLAERSGMPVTRDALLLGVWQFKEVPMTRSVDICIARLRRKIEIDPHRPRFIRTAHGDGYVLTTSPEPN